MVQLWLLFVSMFLFKLTNSALVSKIAADGIAHHRQVASLAASNRSRVPTDTTDITTLSFGASCSHMQGCFLQVRRHRMKDTFKKFIEIRTQAINASNVYVAPALIRKATPEQLDRLLNISPSGESRQDFHW
jgi:hypothetical protein